MKAFSQTAQSVCMKSRMLMAFVGFYSPYRILFFFGVGMSWGRGGGGGGVLQNITILG